MKIIIGSALIAFGFFYGMFLAAGVHEAIIMFGAL